MNEHIPQNHLGSDAVSPDGAAAPIPPQAQSPTIQNPSSPLSVFPNNTSPASNHSKSKKAIAVMLIIALLFLTAAGGLVVYLSLKSQSTNSSTPPTTPTTSVKPSPTPDPIAAWQTYSNKYFSISYPSDWHLTAPSYADSGFDGVIQLDSPTYSSELLIGTKFSFPHGFGPGQFQYSDVTVPIGQKRYPGEETRLPLEENSSDLNGVYTMVEVSDYQYNFVDPTGQEVIEPLLVIFGNTYPLRDVKIGQESTPTEYWQEKDTLLQILSTLTFLN